MKPTADSLYLQEIFSSIQGEGLLVGVRQIFVRLFGCHLDCGYCDTPETKLVNFSKGFVPPFFGFLDEVRPNPVAVAELADIIATLGERDAPHHSVAITGGEPLLQSSALARLIPRLSLPAYLETAGDLPDQLALIADSVRWIAMDIKLPSATGDVEVWDRHERFLEVASRSTATLFAKCVVTASALWEEIEQAAKMTKRWSVPLILQPVTPLAGGPEAPSAAHIMEWSRRASHINADTRVIPQTHKQIGLL